MRNVVSALAQPGKLETSKINKHLRKFLMNKSRNTFLFLSRRCDTGYTLGRMRKCLQSAGVLMVNTFWLALFLALLTAISPVSAQQVLTGEDDRRFRMSLGLDYTSGSYGADENTEILFMPLSLQAEQGPWTVRAVVPWLHVAGPALVLDGGEGGATAASE